MADPVQPSNLSMAVAASALQAQQARMRIIAENIANADSTSQTAGGDPYRRQVPVFAPVTVAGGAAKGVKMSRVVADQSDFTTEYAPGHPGADAKGYVKLPNVDPLMEALDMQEAQRAYQANVNVIETAREMDSSTLSILTSKGG
jgi:flagellar basal-body rod protein FlgC